ncbi:MAG: acyl--CoA ligase [Alphaproteobacteria bacterium]|nr:acyl--CoA ligase [Alphaproteobacteria bacterium]
MREALPPDPSTFASLGELLDDALQRHKSRVALIEADRKREVSRRTYADVDREAARVALRLERQGIGPGSRVAVLMANQPAWLITAVAVFRRGATLVPLDAKLGPDEQRALLVHVRADLVVIDFPLWRKLPDPPCAAWVNEAPPDEDVARFEDLPEGEGTVVARSPEDTATIVYSSGTGGRPKGCVLSHRAYLAQLEGLLERFPMAPGDLFFSVLPTNHAIDFMVGFVGPFVCGAAVVHQRTLRPEMLRFTMQRYGVTHMAVVPMLLAAFERALDERLEETVGWRRAALDAMVGLNQRLTRSRPDHRVSSALLRPIHDAFGGRLRLLFCGGAFTERRLAERFIALGLPVVVGYGLTEACTVATVNGLRPPRADSVGDPVARVEVRVDRPDGDGVGEVCLRGPTLMDGYLDDPELTSETLRDGWLHTGDLGWIDASRHLHLVGRLKDVIVTDGGKNVYPEDVEFAFGGIDAEEVAVFARNTLWPRRGMTGEQMVVVVRPGSVPVQDLLPELASRNRTLPAFKRVGGVIAWDRAFPRTASLKLKRAELAAALRDGGEREVLSLG